MSNYPRPPLLLARRVGLLEVGALLHNPPHAESTSKASLGNPLFLIKARMQAYSPALPVGAQHYYKNSFHALSVQS
jgi:hypothetical protein